MRRASWAVLLISLSRYAMEKYTAYYDRMLQYIVSIVTLHQESATAADYLVQTVHRGLALLRFFFHIRCED